MSSSACSRGTQMTRRINCGARKPAERGGFWAHVRQVGHLYELTHSSAMRQSSTSWESGSPRCRPEIVFIPHPGGTGSRPRHGRADRGQRKALHRLDLHRSRLRGVDAHATAGCCSKTSRRRSRPRRAAIEYFASQTARRDYADGTTGLNRYRGSTSAEEHTSRRSARCPYDERNVTRRHCDGGPSSAPRVRHGIALGGIG